MAVSTEKYDVVVLGGGIAGLSTLYFLANHPAGPPAKLGWATAGNPIPGAGSVTRESPGYVVGGQIDNYTRVSHAHGRDFAQSLWQFGHAGFDLVAELCQRFSVDHLQGRRRRLILSEPELKEAAQACEQMQADGFAVDWQTQGLDRQWPKDVLGVQDEGPRSAWLDVSALLTAMQPPPQVKRFSAVNHLETTNEGVSLVDASGRSFSAEIVVLCCHLNIRELIPTLESALVPVADQWQVYGPQTNAHAAGAGDFTSINNGYEWLIGGPSAVYSGGGRYLRSMAGIGARVASYDQRISRHVHGRLFQALPQTTRHENPGYGGALLDCRPCDELPLIGPMFGESRLIVATGFMDAGISQGALAGRCVAEIIMSGACEQLPRRLWPERLRTMKDS